MSGILKPGLSGLVNNTDNAKKYCKDKYGPEWELDFKEFKILNAPFYLGRCIHKSYTGSDSFCCDNFLLKNEVFGEKGANGNSQTTCNQDTNNVLTCNRINRRDECTKKIIDGQSLGALSLPSEPSEQSEQLITYNNQGDGVWSGESANEYVCTGAKGRNTIGNNGDYNRYCIFDNEIDAKNFCNSDLFCEGYIQKGNMFTATKKVVVSKIANGVYQKKNNKTNL